MKTMKKTEKRWRNHLEEPRELTPYEKNLFLEEASCGFPNHLTKKERKHPKEGI